MGICTCPLYRPSETAGRVESAGAERSGAERADATSPTTSPATASPTPGPRRATTRAAAAVPRQPPAASRWRLTLEEASPVAKVKGVLQTWLWIFVGVGLQMTWILGPFVGNPQGPFVWFHPPGEGNFLQGFWSVLTNLFG